MCAIIGLWNLFRLVVAVVVCVYLARSIARDVKDILARRAHRRAVAKAGKLRPHDPWSCL